MSSPLVDLIYRADKKSKEIDSSLDNEQAAIIKAELYKALALYHRIDTIYADTPNFDAIVKKASNSAINYDEIFTTPGYQNKNSMAAVSNSLNEAIANPDGLPLRSGEPGSGKNGIRNIRRNYAKKIMLDASANLQATLANILTNEDYTLSLKASEIANRAGDIVAGAAGTAITYTPAGVAFSLSTYLKGLVQLRKTQTGDATAQQQSQGKKDALKSTAMLTAGLGATAATALGAPMVAGAGIIAGASLAMYGVSSQAYALIKRMRANRSAYADLLDSIVKWNEYAIYIVSSTDDGRGWDMADLGALGDVQAGRGAHVA